MRPMRLQPLALALALAIFAGAPLAAYTIWLKDGSTVVSRGKYEVKGTKAIITLPNGTQTFIDFAAIDVAKTDAANHGTDFSVMDLGNTRTLPGHEPPPAKGKSLGDLVATHAPSARELPSAKRSTAASSAPQLVAQNGVVDLMSVPPRPFPQIDVATDLQLFFHGQGVDQVQLLAGTKPERVLAVVSAGSEAAVFQGLTASSNALLHARDRFPKQVASFEVLFLSPERSRGGQFLLTPENAADLVAKKIDPAAFFVRNVQF